MQSKVFFQQILISICLLSISLSACHSMQAGVISTVSPTFLPRESLSTASPSPSFTQLPIKTIKVVFVKDGNLQVWDEATEQTRTIVNTGDVSSVKVSNADWIIAFTRRSWVGDVLNGYEQFSLWVMNLDGGNPRELITAQDLRQQINPSERDSSNFYKLVWVSQTHKLIFSGTKYIVQAEGLSHALPHGVFLVDTDNGSVTTLAEASENLDFVPSPDGNQIALISSSVMGLINQDGTNRRQGILTYTEVGLTGPVFPTGVWTNDSRAFVMTASIGMDPNHNIDFTIWRIPSDGSSPQALATVTGSDPNSVTFAPDGKSASYLQTTNQQPPEIMGWFIISLIPEVGPLALPYYGKEAPSASLHWSPSNAAFTIKDQNLLLLCPNVIQDSQVCGEPIHLGSRIITSLQWVDESRFLFEGEEPSTLSLGNVNGTIIPIVTWTKDESFSDWSFYTSR